MPLLTLPAPYLTVPNQTTLHHAIPSLASRLQSSCTALIRTCFASDLSRLAWLWSLLLSEMCAHVAAHVRAHCPSWRICLLNLVRAVLNHCGLLPCALMLHAMLFMLHHVRTTASQHGVARVCIACGIDVPRVDSLRSAFALHTQLLPHWIVLFSTVLQ